jgi:hypothetical protein
MIGRWKLVIITALLLVTLVALGTISGEDEKTLHSKEVETAPVIDGVADDAAWTEATSITTTIGITFKSVYKGDEIFFLAIWSDSTKDIIKKEWIFDDPEWDIESSEEDSLAFNWNIDDSVADFNNQGCAVLCHPPQMKTNAASEKVDVWEWKSARTNPSGWIDDKWMGPSGRDGDDKVAGGIEENKQTLDFVDDPEDHDDVPLYWEPNAQGDDAKSITQSEIDSGEAKEITEAFSNGSLKDEDGTTIPSNTVIPFYYQSKPAGSRGDISAAGAWVDGKWTLEFSRKLNTGESDDIQFNDLDKSYYFGIAIHDHSEGGNHEGDPNVYKLSFSESGTTSDKDSGDFLSDGIFIILVLILMLIMIIVLVAMRAKRK